MSLALMYPIQIQYAIRALYRAKSGSVTANPPNVSIAITIHERLVGDCPSKGARTISIRRYGGFTSPPTCQQQTPPVLHLPPLRKNPTSPKLVAISAISPN